MSSRKGKSSSQSTSQDKGVAPARGKEKDKRNFEEPFSPALPPAPPLAKTRAGTKTLESANQKITGLAVATETNSTSDEEDILLEGEEEDSRATPMEVQNTITEKKTLLAWRQAYKKTRCNLDRAKSHLEFIRTCMGNKRIPRGLQVKVQCNALLSDLTDVKSKFQCTRGMAEKEFIQALEEHYVKLLAQLERELIDVECNMALELRNAPENDRKSHETMMEKTRENIEKLGRTLEDTKKRKMEMLTRPQQKRPREDREPRKRDYHTQTKYPRPDRPQQSRQAANKQPAAYKRPAAYKQPAANKQPATNRQPAPQAEASHDPPPLMTSQPPMAQQSNTAELSTIASLLNQLIMQGSTQQQPPQLLQAPCAVGLQPPQLQPPTVSVMSGQPPQLPGHYQQVFRH